MKYDLSVIIPAREEEWLSVTVDRLIERKHGKTEVIVICDGYKPEPKVKDHPDVRIIFLPESIGQRAAQNMGVRLSRAKYVMKLDAHCDMSEGFDVEMLKAFEEVGDDVTMAPMMLNLWVYDWKCLKCGSKWYQGPAPTMCMKRGPKSTSDVLINEDCNNTTDFTKKVIFKPRPDTPHATSYRFDNMLHFQYFDQYKGRQQGDLVESMSLQGSCFMTTRERYWRLDLCDETWGSWGQQGAEVAIKSWLSGGKVIINKRCTQAHCFRTQPGFSFPYQQSGKGQQKARDICNDIFKNNKWEHQVRPLSWLVEKFWPVPGWSDEDLAKIKTVPLQKSSLAPGVSKGILYFSDNELPLKIAKPVQKRIREIAEVGGYELVSSTRKPMHNMGKNVVTDAPRGYLTMFKQILKGLETMESDVVFMAEHDVLYDTSHFDFTPPDKKFYYDQNWYKVHPDGCVVSWKADQVSGLCAYRDELIKYYKYRIETFDRENFDRKFEPFSGEGSASWEAPVSHIDIRHNKNLTFNKRSLDDFRNKATAINFTQTTIEEIPSWDLTTKDIYG